MRERDRMVDGSLRQEIGISEEEIGWRKAFLELRDDDTDRLKKVHDQARDYSTEVIEAFYAHLLSHERTATFFRDPDVLAYVKRKQKEYFLALTQGTYDAKYVDDRLKIGAVHEQIDLPVHVYLGAYAFYIRTVMNKFLHIYAKPRDEAIDTLMSLLKLTFLDIGLALETYIYRRERTIRSQEEAIRELSTPVLQVRERLLILPLVGAIDSLRALQVTEQLLRSIRASRARVAVIDVTGVPVVDSKVAGHLVQTVEAARLLGAETIITGLSPEVARTLVTIGVDLSRLHTVGDLQGGIEEAERILGYRVVRNNRQDDEEEAEQR